MKGFTLSIILGIILIAHCFAAPTNEPPRLEIEIPRWSDISKFDRSQFLSGVQSYSLNPPDVNNPASINYFTDWYEKCITPALQYYRELLDQPHQWLELNTIHQELEALEEVIKSPVMKDIFNISDETISAELYESRKRWILVRIESCSRKQRIKVLSYSQGVSLDIIATHIYRMRHLKMLHSLYDHGSTVEDEIFRTFEALHRNPTISIRQVAGFIIDWNQILLHPDEQIPCISTVKNGKRKHTMKKNHPVLEGPGSSLKRQKLDGHNNRAPKRGISTLVEEICGLDGQIRGKLAEWSKPKHRYKCIIQLEYEFHTLIMPYMKKVGRLISFYDHSVECNETVESAMILHDDLLRFFRTLAPYKLLLEFYNIDNRPFFVEFFAEYYHNTIKRNYNVAIPFITAENVKPFIIRNQKNAYYLVKFETLLDVISARQDAAKILEERTKTFHNKGKVSLQEMVDFAMDNKMHLELVKEDKLHTPDELSKSFIQWNKLLFDEFNSVSNANTASSSKEMPVLDATSLIVEDFFKRQENRPLGGNISPSDGKFLSLGLSKPETKEMSPPKTYNFDILHSSSVSPNTESHLPREALSERNHDNLGFFNDFSYDGDHIFADGQCLASERPSEKLRLDLSISM